MQWKFAVSWLPNHGSVEKSEVFFEILMKNWVEQVVQQWNPKQSCQWPHHGGEKMVMTLLFQQFVGNIKGFAQAKLQFCWHLSDHDANLKLCLMKPVQTTHITVCLKLAFVAKCWHHLGFFVSNVAQSYCPSSTPVIWCSKFAYENWFHMLIHMLVSNLHLKNKCDLQLSMQFGCIIKICIWKQIWSQFQMQFYEMVCVRAVLPVDNNHQFWKNHTTHFRSCEASKCAGPVPEGPVHSCTRHQCFNRAVTQRIPPFELGKYVLTVDSNSELNSNFECDEPCWQPNHPDWKSDTPAWQVMSLVSNRFKGKCTVISTSLWQHIKFSFSVCGLQFFLECCFWCCSHSAGCLQTTPSLLRADADKQPLGMSDLTFQLSRNPTKSMNVDLASLNFMLFHSQWSEVARNWALFLVSFGLWCFCPRAMPRQCGVPSLEQCFE